MPSVLIVDDEPNIRRMVGALLSAEGYDVRDAADGKTGFALAEAVEPDVALVDLMMPVMDGVETTERIRRLDPQARVVILSSSESAMDAARADRAGARGYLTKEVDAKEIAMAIREAHAGRVKVRRGRLHGPARIADDLLTDRESEVLAQLRTGASNAQIGRALAISELTVKTHIKSLMTKLQATDRTGVVARAFDLGLLKAGG
jgi:two-component system NarL family response regulator